MMLRIYGRQVLRWVWLMGVCLGCFQQSYLSGLECVSHIYWFSIVYNTYWSRSHQAHFSENWGYLSLSPVLGGNLFSIAFGRNLDSHSPSNNEQSAIPRADTPSEPQCLDGRNCYVASLHITITACCLALLLSIWAGWRDRQKSISAALRGKVPSTEVVWEDEEE
jgi:hypothetical protein